MADRWPIHTVAELASPEPYSTQIGPFGNKIRAEIYTATGAPVLRGINVNSDGRFHDDDFVFIDSHLADSEFGKFVCEANDVILCHKGTLGKIGIIPEKSKFKSYIMGNSMMKVRCNRSRLEPMFLYYWLCSPAGQEYLFSRVSQVGVPQIQRPLTTLREAPIPVPPIEEQKEITKILSSLDDKIELNRRMNATLEAMARALFKAWFVDFEPVHANLENRPSASASPEIAKLFPSDFENGIPKGWAESSFAALAKITTGKGLKRSEFTEDGEFPVIGANGKIGKASSWLVDETLITTGRVGTLGNVRISRGKAWISDNVLISKPHRFFYYTYYVLQGFDFASLNRGSTQPLITQTDLNNQSVMHPNPEVLEAFEPFASSLFEKISQNDLQNQTLSEIRDALLPRLISGSIRVGAEE